MDMEGVESYSVFTLYNPFRLIVDFRRKPPLPSTPIAELATVAPVRAPAPVEPSTAAAPPAPPEVKVEPKLTLPAPSGPAVNSNGGFSIARQLGLGVSRIVIDPGHGGHDPGARANGLNEAELVLDVALRLQKLLEKQPGIDVTMTRETDVFIPLEERTAIANREGADLFLSIHANASRNTRARGVETYFLNFASNPEAEAVAARENAASGRTMHSLPEIVRAIALNNKLDESRDFADMVQRSLVRRLSGRNKALRDLGVKQAPFVVLIGAGMPSVLAEISFVTNRQEGQLLKSAAYRQHIAEALQEAIVRYQRSLKKMNTVARK
jgi:N-acetylmuramoyl-L-alanine amidase